MDLFQVRLFLLWVLALSYRPLFELRKCPHCNCDMKHLGFSYYQCSLTIMKFPHEIDPSLFNPLCLVAQKL